MNLSPTYGLFVILILIVIIYFKNKRHKKGIKEFPTPPSLPLLGNALDLKSASDIIPVIDKYSKYGKIVKFNIGPEAKLLITDCKLMAYILSSNKILTKGVEYRTLKPWLGQGLITANGDSVWKTHRKRIGRCFQKNIYSDFISVYERNSNILVNKWRKELGSSSFDICHSISCSSIDIICEAAMGTSVNAQESPESNFMKNIKFMCDLVIDRIFTIYLRYDFLYRFTTRYQKEQVVVKELRDYSQRIIENRKQEFLTSLSSGNDVNGRQKLTLLDLLLEENQNGNIFTDADILDQVQTFIFAGHDTVSSALSFAVYCLSENLDVQDKIIAEFLKVLQNDIDRNITVEDLHDMKYLETVIKECLRLYPPLPYYTRSGHEFEFDGYSISKDMSLFFNVYGIHHDKELYPEPEKFIPERFLEPQVVPYSYLPFSAGPRNCIGQKFAMLEMKYVLVTLLKHFVILPSNPIHKVILSGASILASKNGIRIAVQERKL